MKRAHVVMLTLLCAVLVLEVPSGGNARASETSPEPSPVLDIAGKLRSYNPELTDAEADRIATAVLNCREDYGLDPALVTAVIKVESTGRPWVRSPKGALGLMQVMPHMMAPLGMAGNFSTIETNIEAGCLILADNIRRLGEEDGISAYFWGSQIRGVTYLHRVQAAREELRREIRS